MYPRAPRCLAVPQRARHWGSPRPSLPIGFRLVSNAGSPQSVQASEPSHDQQLKMQAIPTLPRPATRYPTSFVGHQIIDECLVPLYSRGWGIEFKPDGEAFARDQSKTLVDYQTVRRTGSLYVKYRFSDYRSAVAFLNDVVNIAEAENHHPNLHIINADKPMVRVTTQTDSAIRPVMGEVDVPALRVMPGITRRDVRLAILAEELYTYDYVVDGRGLDAERQVQSRVHRMSWWDLRDTIKKYTPHISLEDPAATSKQRSTDLDSVSSPQIDATPLQPKV